MMYWHNSQRQSINEARLVREKIEQHKKFTPENAYNLVETKLNGAALLASQGLENVKWYAGEQKNRIDARLQTIQPAILNSVNGAFATIPSTNECWEFLGQCDLLAVIPGAPQVLGAIAYIKDGIDKRTTIKRLTNHEEWLNAFQQNPTLLTDPNVANELPSGAFGPTELLQTLKPQERQDIYMQYINKFIPPDIQKEMGIDRNSPDAFNNLEKNGKMPVVDGTIRGVLGMNDWADHVQPAQEGDVKKYATKSLERYYRTSKGDPRMEEGISRGLETDYKLALQHQPLGYVSAIANDPERLKQAIGPSHMRGALMMGVVDRTKLENLSAGITALENEKNLSKINVVQHLDRLSNATNERVKKEAESMVQKIQKLNGWEMALGLAAVAALIYSARKPGWARTAAWTIGGAYLVQRLVLDDKDPIKRWSNWLSTGASYAKGGNAFAWRATGLQNTLTPGYIDDVSLRANTMINFLDDYNIEYLENQAIGFSFLNEMPLNLIARNFSMTGADGQGMNLNVQNEAVKKRMAESAKMNGWKNGAEQFFGVPENQNLTSEAISYVFFLKAAKKPENKERVAKILDAWRRMPAGTSLSIFGKGLSGDVDLKTNDPELAEIAKNELDAVSEASQEFKYLVAEGQNDSLTSSQSLGSFIVNAVGLESLLPPRISRVEGTPVRDAPPSGTKVQDAPPSGKPVEDTPKDGDKPTDSPPSGTEVKDAPSSGQSVKDAPASGVEAGTTPDSGKKIKDTPPSGIKVDSIPPSGKKVV